MFGGGKISLFDKSPAYDDSHPELKDMGSQSRTRSPERFRASLPDFVVFWISTGFAKNTRIRTAKLTVRVPYAHDRTRTKIRVSYAYRTRIDFTFLVD